MARFGGELVEDAAPASPRFGGEPVKPRWGDQPQPETDLPQWDETRVIDDAPQLGMAPEKPPVPGLIKVQARGRAAFPEGVEQLPDDIGTVTRKAIENVPADLAVAYGGIERMAGEAVGDLVNVENPNDLARIVGREGAELSVTGQLRAMDAAKGKQVINADPGSLEDYIGKVVSATAQSTPGLVLSLLTRNPTPALVSIGLQSAGQSYQSGREQGLGPDAARTYAMLNAAAEALPEMLPLSVFLRTGGSALRKVGDASLTEGATEAFTAGVQALIDQGFLQPDMTWGEAWPRIVEAGIVGAGAGALMGSAVSGAETVAPAVGEAANAALRVSREVLGNGVVNPTDIAKKLKATIEKRRQSAELAKAMEGKSLNERIEAMARFRQETSAPVVGEQPAVTEWTEDGKPIDPTNGFLLAKDDPRYAAAVAAGPQSEPSKSPLDAGETGGSPASIDAASVIRTFEGFRTRPYWDSNAYRVGFGSDTITKADGTVKRVKPGDEVSPEDAERDLARRINEEFVPSITAEVGAEAWEALPEGAQAALASVTYNYGNLPDSVAAAVRSGDIEAVADAVEGLASHNNGINFGRRMQEAAIIRGEKFDAKTNFGDGLQGSPAKRLTTLLDLSERALSKMGGAAAEESRARSLRKLTSDLMGNPWDPKQGKEFGRRQVEANDNAVAQRQNLEYLLGEIRKIAPNVPATAETIEQLETAIETLPPVTSEQAEKQRAEQAPFEADPASEPVENLNTAPEPAQPPPRELVESITPGGKRVSVRPEVVDIGSLQKATGDLQPRNRTRAASDAQIEEIAAKLDFGQLSSFATTDRGAPIIGPDNIVESGNGRIGGIRKAIEAYPERYAEYRRQLEAAGYDMTGIETPVLVGRRQTEMTPAERIEFTRDSNRSATAELSATEQATVDAERIDLSVIDAMTPGENPTAPTSSFARAFLAKLTSTERGALLDKDGRLNSDGQRRIRNALLAAAYGDPQTTSRASEAIDDNAKSITGALTDVAGPWLSMRQDVEAAGAEMAHYDTTDALMGAINLLSSARDKAEQQGRPVKALINEAVDQIDVFSGAVDPLVIDYVRAFYSEGFGRAKSRDDITAFLRAVIAETQSSLKPSMFGDTIQPQEIIGAARKASEREADRTGTLFAAAPTDRKGTRQSREGDGKQVVQRAGVVDQGRTQTPLERARANLDKPASKAVENLNTEPPEPPDVLELRFNPGPGYVPTLRSKPSLPARQVSVEVGDGDLKIGKVVHRDEARKKIIDVIGPRLYQQKIKGKSRLGFYRQQNSEVRVKHYDDIEVMAHEAAHYLDFHSTLKARFTALRQQLAGEINGLSYTTDPQLINIEGWAEFVRLWSTQYATAKRVAPRAVREFEKALREAGLWRKMLAFQKAAHGWYYQGDMARFRGKSGESQHFVDQLKAWARQRPVERFLQGFIDPAYGAKVIEREATGTIASAERSAWKLMRMARGAESMHEAAILDGALTVLPDGSYGTTGKGLLDILWPATKHGAERLDLAMEYFKARRAEELMSQGRERLFTKDEIRGGLALAKTYPEFATMFDEWLAFNDKMLSFYVDMNLLTTEQAAAIRERNKNYVPFYRVIHQVEGEADVRGNASKIGKRLKGGEQATGEIIENIIDGLHSNIQAALTARAKARLFDTISKSQVGSEFAVEIPAGSKPFTAASDAMISKVGQIMVQLGIPLGQASNIDQVLLAHPELLTFWQHNQTPTTSGETGVESVIIGDKLRHFEVNSPLLIELLTAPRSAPAIIRAARLPKRVLTTAITSMPQFQVPNAVRDTMSMAVQSQSGSVAGYETMRGFLSYLRNDQRFKGFRANGGLFSGRVTSALEGGRNNSRLRLPIRPGVQAGFDVAGRALAGYKTVTNAIEQGTRVGEFSKAVDKGVNPLEAAFRGRMISGDFAQMGRGELWSWVLQTIPFANAALRGTETLLTNMFEADGKVRFNGKSAMKFAAMAVTRAGLVLSTMTVLLWLLNHDDERYKGLTVDEKARYWHIWLPSGEHIRVPKPFALGFIFADLPEIALDFMQNKLDGDATNDRQGDKAALDQLAYGLMQSFWFLDYPGVIAPIMEAMQNRKFTGAPIVPDDLAQLNGDDVWLQRTDRTPELYRRIGESFGVSPLLAEHFTKGFLGYVEAYMVDAAEWLFWDREKFGDKPFARDVAGYFTHQFDGAETPFRTKWTEGYYELRARAQSKAKAYSVLFKEAAGRGVDDLTRFTEKDVNLALRSLSKMFGKMDAALGKGAPLLQSIKYNPKLSREEKETQIDAWYEKRNDELANLYKEADALIYKLETGIK